MKMQFLANAVGSPPAAPGSPSVGNPTDGSPGVQEATIPGAYSFYMLFKELENVITAAGLTPSANTLTQLLSAIPLLTVPPGSIMMWPLGTAPAGWLKGNGANVSRTTYADLFAKIGTNFGSGDGSTTFGLPELRAEFPRFWDDSRGIDTSRTIGSKQKGSLAAFDINTLGTQCVSTAATTRAQGLLDLGYDDYFLSDYTAGLLGGSNNTSGLVNLPGNSEISSGVHRPRNVALLGIIKY